MNSLIWTTGCPNTSHFLERRKSVQERVPSVLGLKAVFKAFLAGFVARNHYINATT